MLSILLPGYQLSSPIYESVNSLVYQGQRERDGLPVILKILKSDRATATEIARYHQEYHITQQLDLDGVVRAVALETYQNTLAIVLEDFGGLSLKQYLAQRPSHRLRLPEFLDLAIQIVEILGQIHGANIIHKDINPANLLYNPELNCVKVIDFGISSQVTPPYTVLPNPSILEGTLPYMSPEQTGRMNCSLDYRSDFYSLGVTFYELLLGRLPFDSTDTMELVHCHIAQNPTPPHEIDASIPPALSGILLKLLAKTADERYQSAWGIQTDLVLCLMQLEATGTIEDVTPGENDVVNKFRIPQTIYGRDRQLGQLHQAFEAIGAVPQADKGASPALTRTQSTSAIFIMGESGIGKTALVAESYKPLTRHCGYFVSGTFQRSRRDSSPSSSESMAAVDRTSGGPLAYGGWISALSELIRQLLTETETSLGQWRDRILHALLPQGQPQPNSEDNADFADLLALIPELQLVLGPNLPPNFEMQERRLGDGEAYGNRNRPTCPRERLQQLLQVFARSSDPFVVFLDNLQWADLDSLALIETLLSDPKSQSFLVIAAYRDNQTRLLRQPLAHPPTSSSRFALNSILSLQERLQERGCRVEQLHLQGLELEAIAALVADTLQNSLKTVMPLAALISQKTNGNPFFVREFLKTLDREQLLRFDDESMSWQWDIERIKAQDITDNVLEFLLDQFKTLPSQTQYLLHLGSVVGMEFDLDLIADLVNGSPEELFQNLIPALVEGLVQPQAKNSGPGGALTASAALPRDPQEVLLLRQYQFLHEQVQQAAYQMAQGRSQLGYACFPQGFASTTAPLTNREGAPKISADTAKLHLQIGKRLLQRAQHPPVTPPESSSASGERVVSERSRAVDWAIPPRDIFEIVYHWNLGQGAIAETEETIQRAQLNYLAAQRARLTGEYTGAIAYSLAGIEALGETAWSATPQLSFNLHLERARANLLQGNLDRSQDLLKILYQQQPQDALRTELDRLALAALSLRGEVDAADSLARSTLLRLGLAPELPPLISGLPIASLPHWHPDQLSQPPSEAISALDQLLGQTLTFYLTYAPRSACCQEIVQQLLRRSQQLGPTPATPLAAAVYSVMLLNQGHKDLAQTWVRAVEALLPHPDPRRGDPLRAGSVAELWSPDPLPEPLYEPLWSSRGAEGTAQETARLAQLPSSREAADPGLGHPNPYPGWSDLELARQVYPRLYGIPRALSLLDAAERHSRGVGDWLALGVMIVERLYLEFYGGKALNILAGDIAQALEWCRKYQHHWAMDALKALQMPLRYLRVGLTAEEMTPEVVPLAQLAPSQRRLWACTEIHCAWILYLEREYEPALARLEGVMTASGAIIAPGEVSPLTWALGRSIMALCWSALTAVGEPLPEPFLTVAAELESWSHDCPETFASLAAMVRGERYRLQGNEGEAIDEYDAAIERAVESHCPYGVTLAHELAAQFWLQRQKPKIARVYLAEAYTAYQRWGARHKVEQLAQTYGSLLSVATLALQNEADSDSFNRRVNMSLDYTRSRAAVLDVTTVMKAARSLSGEIVLDRLLGKLMKLAIANAGATRGAIILDRMGQLTLEIVQTVGDLDEESEDESGEGSEEDNRPLQSGLRPGISIEACDSLPRSAIHYVARTNESVVLNDATAESAFVNDLYIQQFQPKSLLCAPIQGKGKLIGLLYLENNLTAGAFTRDRLDVLMLLCAQAAIALENARLYENLKQSELRERDRAQQLRDSLEELQQAQLQLVQSEKMATLGQLVAGVAHEINNPVGFVDANLSHAAGYIEDLLGLLELYQETFPDPGEDIEEEMEEIDLEFILKDLPQILSSMSVGTERIRQISRSLRTFSRADTSAKVAVNIHEGIDSTLMILKPRLKFTQARPSIQIVKDYGNLPEIKCYAGQLNQVFMNIIANAIDAFDEANEGLTFEEIEQHPNEITISTELVKTPPSEDAEETNPDWVIIRIRDNGPGMPDEVRDNIFNHLFTTKAVGKGTGLGLSISHQIVVEKHQGRLSCLSSVGEGTEFVIEIPSE
ncbi:ATP-binding sensor histidine kinase [Sodalinema gerasimenkoae]|uniref:ATP-binding sensor histidine kinase n=1 Tax=Sodalinema gerasimenkoae TaxID=2862348 RepID=UPI001356DF49|nr:AAA family ATPase [Sodalinema gerasimenkoae]